MLHGPKQVDGDFEAAGQEERRRESSCARPRDLGAVNTLVDVVACTENDVAVCQEHRGGILPLPAEEGVDLFGGHSGPATSECPQPLEERAGSLSQEFVLPPVTHLHDGDIGEACLEEWPGALSELIEIRPARDRLGDILPTNEL